MRSKTAALKSTTFHHGDKIEDHAVRVLVKVGVDIVHPFAAASASNAAATRRKSSSQAATGSWPKRCR